MASRRPPGDDPSRPGQPGAAWPARVRFRWRLPALLLLLAGGAAVIAIATLAALHPSEGPAGREKGPPSIAVLPFANLSGDPSQDYFSDGLSEEILNELSHVDGLRVTGRTSSFAFKGKEEDVRAIGRKLGVESVIAGSVRRSGDRVRVTAQMVGVADGFQAWSRSYDREVGDVFAVQAEIASLVAGALRTRLARGGRPPGRAAFRPHDPEAYNQYLLGRQFIVRGTPADYRRAVDALEKAVRLDPEYAPAWASLASALGFRGDYAETAAGIAEDKRLALAAAEKAILLAPDLDDGYLARGFLRASVNCDWVGAGADMERALELNSGDPDAHRLRGTWVLASTGRLDEAIAALRRATELDPLNVENWGNLGFLLLSVGKIDAARQALDRAQEVAPEDSYVQKHRAVLALVQRRPSEARDLARANPADLWRVQGLALAEHDLGNAAASEAALAAFQKAYAHSAAFQIAEIHAWRGEPDLAFSWLERARAERDSGLAQTLFDPLLVPLHGDPRWTPFLRKVNLAR